MPIRPLSAALQKKAEEELNETPSRITTDLQILRDWLKQQPHLCSIKENDQWLVAFLRGCKYDVEKAKGKIDMFYTLKATIPEFYADRDPMNPDIQELLKSGVFLPLKKTTKEDSPRTIILRLSAFSATSRHLSEFVKLSLMILEILLLEDDHFTIAGEELLAESKDVRFGLVWNWTPSFAKKLTSCSEKALSVRVKSFHILNPPFFIAPAIKLFKMFLGAKLKNRIFAHTKDCETLFEHVDKSILPEEYGGTDGTVQDLIDHWKAKVESYRDWYVDKDCYSDETKRTNPDSSSKMALNK